MVTSYRVTSVWGQRIEALLQGRFCRKGKEDEALCVLYFLHKGGDVSQWYMCAAGRKENGLWLTILLHGCLVCLIRFSLDC